MDQTDFSLLVGLLFGAPIVGFLLLAFTPLPLWVAFLIAYTLGTILVGLIVYLLVGIYGKILDRQNKSDD